MMPSKEILTCIRSANVMVSDTPNMRRCRPFVLHLLVICFFWLACLKSKTLANQDLSCRAFHFLPVQWGQHLESHVFMNISVGKDQCERWCLMDNKCVSVNIGSEKSPNSVICELSDSDHCQHPEDLKPRQGWTYRGAKNPCCYNPCLNNGKCLLGYTDKNYVCECPSGFTGENCENDVDECSTGIHDCNENATCANTAGNFNCKCKPGFTGDGLSCSDCTGKLNYFTKHQDLPTQSAKDVEVFTIDGSLFMAFAQRDDSSFIYKLNESAGNFTLHQTIDTIGAYDIEYFMIADKHYIAIAILWDHTYNLNSSVFQWNGHSFELWQNISTAGATSFNFFKIHSELFAPSAPSP